MGGGGGGGGGVQIVSAPVAENRDSVRLVLTDIVLAPHVTTASEPLTARHVAVLFTVLPAMSPSF